MVTGVIEDTEENEHTKEVKVRFDRPHQWGDDLYNDVWAWGRKIDEFGTLRHLQLLEDKPDFQTMTVVFSEPISQIDRSIFEDAAAWGVCSLQGWVNKMCIRDSSNPVATGTKASPLFPEPRNQTGKHATPVALSLIHISP